VTYVNIFDEIWKLFAKTDAACERSFGAGQFSFNASGGRCAKCSGKGTQQIEMHFLSDVSVDGPECHGTRFNAETLGVKYNGRSIHDVLQMTVDEAVVFFKSHDRIVRVLGIMQEIGLGYIRSGQGAMTLSGGEAQWLKLAKELSHPVPGFAMYVLDEPTTGLHFEDIRHLLSVLRRL
jgi:excinuclease ABC subunit A